jgi:hypothetical protein
MKEKLNIIFEQLVYIFAIGLFWGIIIYLIIATLFLSTWYALFLVAYLSVLFIAVKLEERGV